jgi:hypothetical protein
VVQHVEVYPHPPIGSIAHLCEYMSAEIRVKDGYYEPSFVMYRPLRPLLLSSQGPTFGWDIAPYIEACYYHMLGEDRDDHC